MLSYRDAGSDNLSLINQCLLRILVDSVELLFFCFWEGGVESQKKDLSTPTFCATYQSLAVEHLATYRFLSVSMEMALQMLSS